MGHEIPVLVVRSHLIGDDLDNPTKIHQAHSSTEHFPNSLRATSPVGDLLGGVGWEGNGDRDGEEPDGTRGWGSWARDMNNSVVHVIFHRVAGRQTQTSNRSVCNLLPQVSKICKVEWVVSPHDSH